MTDLVVSDVMPLVLTRSYNSQDPYGRAFGVGMSHSFGLFEHSEVWPAEADLYLPDGGKIHFARVSDPSLAIEETVFEHTATGKIVENGSDRAAVRSAGAPLHTSASISDPGAGSGCAAREDRARSGIVQS